MRGIRGREDTRIRPEIRSNQEILFMDFSGERFVPGTDSGLLEAEHLQRYAFAGNYVKGKSVLDIACGAGYGSSLLLKEGATAVTGVDISAEAIHFAKNTYGKHGIRYIVHDAENFRKDSYDVIVSFETFEHLDNRQRFLENLFAMLHDTGLLIISTPNKAITSPMKPASRIRNIFHKYEYLEREFIAALQGAGFTRIQKFGQHSYPRIFQVQFISKLLRRLWKRDSIATATVVPLDDGHVPRYFVFVASK
jgi:O-antigen biosynthesis protein